MSSKKYTATDPDSPSPDASHDVSAGDTPEKSAEEKVGAERTAVTNAENTADDASAESVANGESAAGTVGDASARSAASATDDASVGRAESAANTSPKRTPDKAGAGRAADDASTRSANSDGDASQEAARSDAAPEPLPDFFPTAACTLAPQEAPNQDVFEKAQRFIGGGFGHWPLKGITNVRDLGGMPAADGRTIRPHKLIRSGLLHDASRHSIAALKALPLARVIDLRTDVERERDPDPISKLGPVSYDTLSVLTSSALGISFDESFGELLEQFGAYHNDATKPSIGFYPSLLLSGSSIEMWRYVFECLLKGEEGAVLWHCTAGKDRTGLAAFLIETALGVPQDLVMEDYLASNNFTEPFFSELVRTNGLHKLAPKTLEMVHVLFTVNPEYLEVAVAAVLQRFGTIDAYFEQALGLSEDDITHLRDLYLE